ncbi:hypothetical protein CHUAL_004172 [Chamberlinius hualienensis]
MGDFIDEIVRYGLFFGALFQMLCIAAVIFMPPKEDGKDINDSSDDETSIEGSPHINSFRQHGHTHRRNKQDKKKRR